IGTVSRKIVHGAGHLEQAGVIPPVPDYKMKSLAANEIGWATRMEKSALPSPSTSARMVVVVSPTLKRTSPALLEKPAVPMKLKVWLPVAVVLASIEERSMTSRCARLKSRIVSRSAD